jgi:hypothetical protein
MMDLFGLIVPVIGGLSFLYWSWRIAPRFIGRGRGFHFSVPGIRELLGFWPSLQFILWIFTSGISTKIVELVITCIFCILYFIYIVRDRYMVNNYLLSVSQLRMLNNAIVSLVSLCCLSIVIAFGLILRFIGWLQSGRSTGFLIGMAILYLVMFGIVALSIKIKSRKEERI